MIQYLSWAGIDPVYEDTFWTSKKVRDLIKDHYNVLVNRRNVFTGKLYKDDDTIFAWDIYNVRSLHMQSSTFANMHVFYLLKTPFRTSVAHFCGVPIDIRDVPITCEQCVCFCDTLI